MQLNLNHETYSCIAVLLLHLAAFAISWRQEWSPQPAVWMLRADLAAMCVYALSRTYTLMGLGHSVGEIDMAYWAIAEILLLSMSFLPLPAWLVWSLYTLAVLLSAAIAIFALTFRMRLF